MHESSSPSHDFLTLADIVGVYGIKGWVRLRIRLDDPNLLLSLPDLTLVAAPDAPRSARQSVVVEALQVHGKGHIAKLSGIADRTQAEVVKAARFRSPPLISLLRVMMKCIGVTSWGLRCGVPKAGRVHYWAR
ncbi:MAG: hypothetical protein CM15mP103_10840 [Gammaproteobacteria bacterium]|nr:MAG: hypothetical protein CM15mP103_10840 [Gammaproteobacteria bacterium]